MELYIILACLFLSGFFSGSEIAFFTLNEAKLYALTRRKVRGARLVYKLRSNPERLLATILIGNNIVNIGMASYTTVWVAQTFGSSMISLATGLITVSVLVFGEILPKSIGQRYAPQVAFFAAWPLYVLTLVFAPLTYMFELMSRWVNRLFKQHQQSSEQAEEELKAMSHIGFKSGLFEEHEHDVIQKIFALNDIPVRRIMVPIDEVYAIKGDMTLAKVAAQARKKHFSRIPIRGDKEGVITGFLYLKDLIRVPRGLWDKKTARQLQRRILTTHESVVLSDLYEDFVDNRIHMAAVYSKEGKLLGIVTIEDILEELLGEIHDETDTSSA